MRTIAMCCAALCLGMALAGCGGGGSTHGATDRSKDILVYDEPYLSLLFPDGTSGGADTLRSVAERMKIEHSDSLGFVAERTGYYWAIHVIPTESRAASAGQRSLVRLPHRAVTRGGPTPYNILLVLDNGDQVLVTDSANDPNNQLAVGFADSNKVVDADATEADLTRVLSNILPVGSDRIRVAQTTAIVALVGWSR